MEGSVFRRCSCRDNNRKLLGKQCPKLRNPKKPHGKWWGRYDEPPGLDGKRRQRNIGPFASKDEAQEELTKILARVNAGTYQPVDRSLTIALDFQRWLDGRIGLKSTTWQQTQEIGDLYVKPGLGYLHPTDLREHHIEDLHAAMRQIGRTPHLGKRPGPTLRRLLDARTDTKQARRPLSRARIRRVHAVVHGYLNSAVRRNIIPRNPAANVELQRGRSTRALLWTPERVARWRETGRLPSRVMVWSPDQAGAFLDSIVADRLYPLFHLVAYRGLRRGEALGLPWTDLDLDNGTLAIRETLPGIDDLDPDHVDFDDPRSPAGERVISLDIQTVAVLREWRRRQQAERRTAGPAWVDSGRVFTKPTGEPLNPDTVSQHFDRLVARTNRPTATCAATTSRGRQCQRLAVVDLHGSPRCGLRQHGGHDPQAIPLRRAGLPPIRFHGLRHTAASLTYAATKDLRLVSELIGHSSTKITGDIYTNIFADVDRAAAEAAAQLVPRRQTWGCRAHTVPTTPEIDPPAL